jgi:hypothetical protein
MAIVAALGEPVGERDGLALGAAVAQVAGDEENPHRASVR